MRYPLATAENMILMSQIKEIEHELQFNWRRYTKEQLASMDKFRKDLYNRLEMG